MNTSKVTIVLTNEQAKDLASVLWDLCSFVDGGVRILNEGAPLLSIWRAVTDAAAPACLENDTPDFYAALVEIADAGEKAKNSYSGDGWRLAHEKFSAFARAVLAKATGGTP